ncbi:hypothetical protein F2P45_20115 [Massilia sp. CCM 8733]|uniref:Uncharacterized protein n=1 Tax=Massilia mucilaginosa TaxID=2609282 RepID=A0ABX0NY38_9BURK|nr:hypothetical protein [Massilia mucilaginosa]NHZ91302.1 hypothetical protein [Massilia mucilaginosa]
MLRLALVVRETRLHTGLLIKLDQPQRTGKEHKFLTMSCIFRYRVTSGRKRIAFLITHPVRMPSTHLRRLPVQGGASLIDIHVHDGAMADALRWRALVQPHVRAAGRLDAAWDWPSIYKLSLACERTFGRNVSLQCIDIANGDEMPLPLAIMLLAAQER